MTTLEYGRSEWWRVVRTVLRAVVDRRDIVFTPTQPAIFLGDEHLESAQTDHTP